MYMYEGIGNEGFVLDKNTLGKDLEGLFTEIYNARGTGKFTEENALNVFLKTYGLDMLRILSKHTGVDFHTINVPEMAGGQFAIAMEIGDSSGYNAHYTIERFSGTMEDKEAVRRMRNLSKDDLIKLTKALDDEGHLTKKLKFNDKAIGATIFFDIWSAFFAKEKISKHVEYMTPKEIVGVILHETGHMMTLIENAGYSFYRATMRKAYLDKYLETASPLEAMAYIKEELAKVPPSGTQLDKAKIAVDNMEKITIDAKQKEDSVLSMVGDFILRTWFLVIAFIPGALVNSLVFRPLLKMALDLTTTKVNTNELDWSSRNMVNCERLADEYVARHGYSSALASGLLKIMSEYAPHYAFNFTENGTHTRLNFELARWVYMVTILSGTIDAPNYDPMLARIDAIVTDTIKALKDCGQDPRLTAKYIEEYDKCVMMAKRRTNMIQATEAASKLIWGFFDYLLLPTSIFDMVVNGRYRSEYDLLVKTVDKLRNNKLYVEAARLHNAMLRLENHTTKK